MRVLNTDTTNMKFLYHNRELYKVFSEKKDCYKIQKCEEFRADLFDRTMSLRDGIRNDYMLFGSYNPIHSTITTFNKQDHKDDYIIIDNIDFRSDSLFIKYKNGKLTYEVIPLVDEYNVKIAEQMLWIIDNFKTLYYRFKETRETNIVGAQLAILDYNLNVISVLTDEIEEDIIYALNHLRDEFNNLMSHITSHARHDDFFEMFEKRSVPWMEMYNLIIEYNGLHINKVVKLLSKEQINKILEIKRNTTLDKDPMRNNWHYTTKELGLASLILSICDNSKESYLFGLCQIFSKPRAEAILRKLVS